MMRRAIWSSIFALALIPTAIAGAIAGALVALQGLSLFFQAMWDSEK